MGFKGLITAATAVALMATPTISMAAQAAPATNSEIAPSFESVEGMQFGGNGVLILGAIILLGLGAWAIWGNDDDDEPVSP